MTKSLHGYKTAIKDVIHYILHAEEIEQQFAYGFHDGLNGDAPCKMCEPDNPLYQTGTLIGKELRQKKIRGGKSTLSATGKNGEASQPSRLLK